MENLELYNSVRSVPNDAKKPISGGRLSGMTDINPMWRIKALTEQFGICGIGWKLEIVKQWTEQGANGEVSAFCNINLYIKSDGEWSEPIPGTGGSALVAKEKNGLYTSDECYKMAFTDAISVACKMLGFGADVYWQKDRTKYSKPEKQPAPQKPKYIDKVNQTSLQFEVLRTGGSVKEWVDYLVKKFPKDPPKSIETITPSQYEWSMKALEKLPTKHSKAAQ